MGLLDKITGKNSSQKAPAKKQDNVLDMVKEQDKPATKTEQKAAKLKLDTGIAHRILVSYHLSEKSNIFSTGSRYVFRVNNDANKIEIKKAVEKVYDVHVLDVNIITVKGKTRRQGRVSGRTKDWKKAVVTLKTGEKISGLAEGV